MNPLYALRKFMEGQRGTRLAPSSTPHVASLMHAAAVAARAERKLAQAARRERLRNLLPRAIDWVQQHRRILIERTVIAVGSVALTWIVGAQPAIDARDAANARLTTERDELRATATRMAQSQLTINLTGHRSDVQKHVRILADMKE